MSASHLPLVTILMPTHNRAHFVRNALDSALAQTYPNIEILLLDNASTDNTGEVLSGYLADPRVRYVRHEVDLGITGNWRYGIGAVNGQFFCLLHDDDTLEPRFLEALVPPLAADASLALAFSDHWVMDKDRRRLPGDGLSESFHRAKMASGVLGEGFAQAVLVDYAVPVGASLFRRAAVEPDFIDPRAKGAIDYWLLYRILEGGHGAFYVDEKLMNYRVHAGGMSASATAYMSEGHLFRFQEALRNLRFAPWHAQIAARRRETLTSYGIDLVERGRRSEARTALWTVLREKPNLRALTAFLLGCLGRPGSWLASRLRASEA